MTDRKKTIKTILLTVFLAFAFIVIAYTLIGILISGPVHKYNDDQNEIVLKIKKEDSAIKSVTRHVFTYVTYTAETKDQYLIYDKDIKLVASRDKSELQLDKVKSIIKKKYSGLKDADIEISYGKDSVVYDIEKGNTILLLDFDTLEEVYYMKEG